MNGVLYQEFTLTAPPIGASLVSFLKFHAPAAAKRGAPLRVIVTDEEMDRLDVQIAYYFGALMKQITEQAWVNGRQYSKDVWHEHFAKLFLPAKEIELPDGEIVLKRGSIARGKIGLKAMSMYTLQVTAYATSELGCEIEVWEAPR